MKLFSKLVVFIALLTVVGVPSPAGAVNIASTTLLYPFLDNELSGIDTMFTLSNTGADPFGTQSSGGSCAITFYSNGTATKIIIPGTILPGQTATFLLSVINPGFLGYAIAQCDMPFAHGVVQTITEGTFSDTYPALVLPRKRVKADERLMN